MTLPTEYDDGNSLVMKQAADMGGHPHTPGPWQFDLDDFTEVYSPTSGAMICKVWEADDFPCLEEGTHADVQDECLANARLIAAAPDLLEALQAAVSQVHLRDATLPMSPDVQRVFDLCVAAIAKATGAK